jgi:hypothetical protein
MNIIKKLFDKKYLQDLFTEKILPHYSDFVEIKKISITPHKKHIWETTYHVVIQFDITFKTSEGKRKTLPFYCSAHSNEPRKSVYEALRYLWENGFGHGYLSIPHAIFYSEYFKGTFYRGVKGNNLYHYIREQRFDEIEAIVPKTAAWFSKLHDLPAEKAINFNPKNSRVQTVLPGVPHILKKVGNFYPAYLDAYEKIYKNINKKETEFFNSTEKRWMVHGDAHPENVIKMSKKKIAVIDFTDICLSDFARDIGSFMQQLEFMIMRKIEKQDYADKIKELFKTEYFKHSRRRPLTDSVEERMRYYYNWTAMRTATHFLLKDCPEPDRAYPIIEQVGSDLGIK